MSTVGIIAEFNPFHTGHEYLIRKAKEIGTVVCALSGNFVQRGDTAFLEKGERAKSALLCGADLVVALPVLWSMSTAQNFAVGAASVLKKCGCDTLLFGSECGDINALLKTAEILESKEFETHLAEELKKGITFAAARQKAAEKCGAKRDILKGANNNLGIEYILAAKRLCWQVEFKTVKRLGAMHDSGEKDNFVSSSYLRENIENLEKCREFLPQETHEIYKNGNFSDISRLETAVLANLRVKPKEEFKALPDLSEGVENKLIKAASRATTLDELYGEIKVKRYTLARIRRLVLSAFLGYDNSAFLKEVPYLQVLGMTKTGEETLKEIGKKGETPIVAKAKDIETLSGFAKKVFDAECRATDLYALSVKKPFPSGLEYTRKLIKQNTKIKTE